MAEWLYRLTEHQAFPTPLAELAALAAIDEDGKPTYLMLQAREDAAGKNAIPGDMFYLCFRGPGGELRIHGEATVKDSAQQSATPTSVRALYGHHEKRWFVPLERVVLVPPRQVPLTPAQRTLFLRGQAGVRRLHVAVKSGRTTRPVPPVVAPNDDAVSFRKVDLSAFNGSPFVALGLDPTAGTWASKMTRNDTKAMPSVGLEWTGDRIVFRGVENHRSNDDFWARARDLGATLVCIDGPCATNGLRVLPAWAGWDAAARGGSRDGEIELSLVGVGLFWTTHATVTRFTPGASEWIARALRLFDEARGLAIEAIETHPHGAFTLLWRGAGLTTNLPKKTTPGGRAARLAMLRAFVPTLAESAAPDHDAVDACVAALVAILHRLGATRSFGTVTGGGQIWMPSDRARLAMTS